MKKFLSLLLALTMVLSLTVVPARAANVPGTMSVGSSLTIKKGDSSEDFAMDVSDSSISLTADITGTPQLSYNNTAVTGQSGPTYSWTATENSGITFGSANAANTTVSASKAGTYTLTCTATYTGTSGSDNVTGTLSDTISVTVIDCTDGIDSFKVNGLPIPVSSKAATVYLKSGDSLTKDSFTNFQYKSDYTNNGEVSYNSSNKVLSVPVKHTSSTIAGTTAINITPKTVTVSSVSVTEPASAPYYAGQNIKFTATVTDAPSGAQYVWTYSKDGGTSQSLATTDTNVLTTKAFTVAGSYVVSCAVKFGSVTTDPKGASAVTVSADPYVPTRDVADYPYAFSLTRNNIGSAQVKQLHTPYLQNSGASDKITSGLSVAWDSSNKSVATVSSTGLVSAGNTTGTSTISAVITYNGKTYPAVTYTVSNYVLSADLSRQTYFNNPVSYTATDLLEAANRALSINGNYSIYGSAQTIMSTTVDAKGLGQTSGSISSVASINSGSISFTPYYNARGKAPITATVKTSTGQSVTVTLNIPVVPIPTTFDSLTAEPVTSNYNSAVTSYRVNFPSTYSTYYVIQKNGTTAPDYAAASLGTAYSASTPYTLTSADFTNGQCTLYVIATNNYTYGSSYGTYYSGAITVTQTNHDIKYNGVVGGTVQFKHNDFTTFMNEMYGTNTTSYLTFNSVKFTSVPNATTQGTLYYNGVAMTTGYGSNYFNTSTAVTNLDNVSFSVSSRVPSTTKEIRIPFTLYATRYNSYGTSAGTSVTYSGVVVISLVREDVTFTVAPGDSVRFTDSAFLTYLRSASGINYNYNIDYVTFDQSAVNALNEGVLYAYSTGFNAVKATDRFYYTTTSYNQNALSDVTFRASTYAKTGTTVYIPFTIYAKYGTSSATRQVTGTVAIKIAQTMNFVDVKTSDYFYDSVKWAVNNNITKGTSATTFSPNNTCTRAEIVTFLWRAAGSPTPTITRNPFTDVKYPVGSDFYNAILWASQNGITAGKTTTTFAPNDNCTRAQIVTFLWRYAKKPLGYYTNPFNDVKKTEHAAYYDAILWAAGKGIATGNTPKTFDPDGTCTRAEAVTFLYRYESTK